MNDSPAHRQALAEIVDLAGARFAEVAEREAEGSRPGQYGLDLAVDGPVVEALLAAGYGVLSEEAGEVATDRGLIAVVDPIDGSTNASIGLPWFATSVCLVDDDGPLVSVVKNHASGIVWDAIRGGGARRSGTALRVDATRRGPIVGVNGVPPDEGPWAQFRCYGAAALDLTAVASNVLDGYVDFDFEAHGVWDYLGAALICDEAGAIIADAERRPLTVLEHSARRTPVAARDAALHEKLMECWANARDTR